MEHIGSCFWSPHPFGRLSIMLDKVVNGAQVSLTGTWAQSTQLHFLLHLSAHLSHTVSPFRKLDLKGYSDGRTTPYLAAMERIFEGCYRAAVLFKIGRAHV